ncbi:hypothetical protein BJF78_32645 [Pseudonocardia sp. CNS-139]|nr:hypothetical protein BJF78_32645 [Pseudonocardia sp. CNS-139]
MRGREPRRRRRGRPGLPVAAGAVKRVNIGNVAIPFARDAEIAVLPDAERIARVAGQLVGTGVSA